MHRMLALDTFAESSEHQDNKRVVIPLFFGLPGLGKTTFWHELKKIRQ